MAAGYEARARVTADVSGFVAGARAVANASNVATAAIKSLSTQLLASQRASNQAAQNMRTFSQAAATVSRSQQQNAQSSSQAAQSAANMAAAYNQGAAAANRSAQAQNSNAQAQRTASTSLQAMGRELSRLRNEQERYQALLAQGQRLTRDQAESYAQIQTRLGGGVVVPAVRQVVIGQWYRRSGLGPPDPVQTGVDHHRKQLRCDSDCNRKCK